MSEYIIKTLEAPLPQTLGLGSAIFEKFHQLASEHKVAQIAETGEEDTYKSLLERCIRTAIVLQQRGIKPGDIISSCLINHLNSCVPLIATQFIGGIYSSLDPALSKIDCELFLEQIVPKIIFVTPESVELIEDIFKSKSIDCEIVVCGPTIKYAQFKEFIEPQSEEDIFEPVEITDLYKTAFLFYSSGNSGLPKAACLNHYIFLHALKIKINISEVLDYGRIAYEKKIREGIENIYLWYATYFWLTATVLLLRVFLIGGTFIVCEQFDRNNIWIDIDKFRVHTLYLSTTLAIEMCRAGKPADIDVTRLIRVVIVGDYFPENFILELRDLLPNTYVYQGYSLTEVGVITMFLPPIKAHIEYLQDKPGSVGMAMNGHTIKIVNPDTNEILGPNQAGELRVKSQRVMNGYYNIHSSDSFDEDGYLKTGDIVYYDEDQCFFIVDRIKELLIYKSWHVHPALIEREILSHPEVMEAVVIGLPNPEDGDHPLAVVVVKENSSITPEELKHFVDAKLDDRKQLRGGVRFVKDLPKTPTNEIKRQNVKEMLANGII